MDDWFRRPDTGTLYIDIVFGFIEGIDPPHAAERSLQIVNKCPRGECIGAIWGNASSKVDVMVDRRFFLGPICEVGFLHKKY
jgi:hypothetical protein